MAVFTAEMKHLTRKLIQTVTGFEHTEENFKLCFRFAKSNFRFHRFLDVNDFQVTRSIKGLYEKFNVHTQPEKAEAFEKLTTQFLNSDLEKNYPKSDAHYGAILLLLCLSDSPLHADFRPRPKEPPPQEMVDTFDWTSYLMEGIEYSSYSDTGSEWSEETEEDREEDTLVEASKLDLDDSAIGEELLDESSQEEVATSKSWLLQHVITPYWDPSNPDYVVDKPLPFTTAHPACNMATNWITYKQHMEPFYTSLESTSLTESQLVRETLWVLLGAERSFVYCLDEREVCVRRGIHVSHLTPLALQRQLEHFANMATLLHHLRQFKSVAVVDDSSCYTRCQTYDAFVDALTHCLEGISLPFQQVEKSIVDNKQFISLMKLTVDLQPTFRELQALHDVFFRAILQLRPQVASLPRPQVVPLPISPPLHDDSYPRAHMCSSRLVTILWDTLQCYDNMGPPGTSMVKLLFPLYILTIRPYMVMLDGWMVTGVLADKHNEFCIQRSAEVVTGSPRYWERSFGLREPVPNYLQPLIDKVLLAGKSMHLIESIGKLKQVGLEDAPPSDLYEEFVQSLRTELLSEQDGGSCATVESGRQPVASTGQELEQAELWNVDPLLKQFFTGLHISEGDCHNPSKALWDDLRAISGHVSLQVPITLIIQKCLHPLLHTRYMKASGTLVRLLKSEYDLTGYFKTVQLFFLMEAGDTMQQFYTDIFQRIENEEPWKDTGYLNSVLQEALQNQYPSVEKSLSVDLQPLDDASQQKGLIYSIASISLNYEVPWPLDTIFSGPLMEIYNKVFHFLLQVKWSKWSLEELRTRACTVAVLPREVMSKVHLLHLLRAKLLHFVNNLNHYLMTRILHSIGLEFQQSISQAEDLDAIISTHKEYVSTIFDRCLLNRKASYVNEALMKVLNLCLVFHQKWLEGTERFSFAEAERIETEFSKCTHFLISCLNNAIKRGSFPHLETLAFSLQTLKPGDRIFSQRPRT